MSQRTAYTAQKSTTRKPPISKREEQKRPPAKATESSFSPASTTEGGSLYKAPKKCLLEFNQYMDKPENKQLYTPEFIEHARSFFNSADHSYHSMFTSAESKELCAMTCTKMLEKILAENFADKRLQDQFGTELRLAGCSFTHQAVLEASLAYLNYYHIFQQNNS